MMLVTLQGWRIRQVGKFYSIGFPITLYQLFKKNLFGELKRVTSSSFKTGLAGYPEILSSNLWVAELNPMSASHPVTGMFLDWNRSKPNRAIITFATRAWQAFQELILCLAAAQRTWRHSLPLSPCWPRQASTLSLTSPCLSASEANTGFMVSWLPIPNYWPDIPQHALAFWSPRPGHAYVWSNTSRARTNP